MCTSLVIWYIVDGHTAGVIVFVFIFTFFEFYLILAYPRFIVVALLSIVTQGKISQVLPPQNTDARTVLIIGYELEVKKVGVTVSKATLPAFFSSRLNIHRWLQATDSHIIASSFSHHIDSPVYLEACSSPLFGPSSHTL